LEPSFFISIAFRRPFAIAWGRFPVADRTPEASAVLTNPVETFDDIFVSTM
jgi:hypothetical protein